MTITHKRHTLTRKEKARKLKDQDNKCAHCNMELKQGDIDFDHDPPIWKRPKKSYNKEDEYNCQKALCKFCHKQKTKREAPERAHYKRLEEARHALTHGVPKQNTKKFNRGWDNRYKRKVGGKSVPRKEG